MCSADRTRHLEAVSPVEIVIDLPRPDQILQLFEPGEAGMIKQLWRKINSLEQGAELFSPFLHIPFAAEARQMPRNLGKRDAITAIVGTNGSEADVTTRKYFADDVGDLADPVI